MRVNENVVALNMQNMLFKNKTMADSLNQKLKFSKSGEDAVELVISEKMKSQIREFDDAEGISCDDETSLNEATTTVQDINKILGDIQEILQAVQDRTTLTEESDILSERFKELQQDFVSASKSEIFNSKWFKNGLITNQEVISSDFRTCDINEVKKLAELYQDKMKELERLNREFKEKIDTGQVTEVNLGAAESHIQNIATAEEIISKTKSAIMKEATNAMLSQANKKPEQVINLLE